MSAAVETKPLYELRKVERRYLKGAAQVMALRGVDLDISNGEFVSIEGPSGSGKSTLLQLVGALDTPTSGSVQFDNQDLSQARDRALTDIRGSRIGFIFQQFNLIPTLSAAENVAIAMDPRVSKSDRRARATELLTAVGLEQRADHLPSRLSGGEQQRVAIARALANRPEVIIADEPTGNLDSQNAADVMALLVGLRSDMGVTLIIATHDEDVAKHASRRIKMRDGAIVSDSGAPPLVTATT
ncbi:MAG: putative transport system ATP-binding protein [Chloroflexota bacterium]|jgi:putative ABC transport system ATP-binding protein|nr:putative transport system ATP-binding protein [Chloroflexota bacterium]